VRGLLLYPLRDRIQLTYVARIAARSAKWARRKIRDGVENESSRRPRTLRNARRSSKFSEDQPGDREEDGSGGLASRTSHRQRSPQALAFSNFRASFARALSCRVGSVIRARFKKESFLKRTQQDVGTIVRKKKTRGPDVWVWRFYETDEMGVTPKRSVMLAGDAEGWPTEDHAWLGRESFDTSG